MDNHSTLQPIPTVRDDETKAHLMRMFDAALALTASVTLYAPKVPHAADMLKLWAGAHYGVVALVEHVFPGVDGAMPPYVNLEAKCGDSTKGYICIIKYRDATPEDIERHNATCEAKERI